MTEIERKRYDMETDRLMAENRKLLSESYLYGKKTKWYEITLFLALGAIIATLAGKFS